VQPLESADPRQVAGYRLIGRLGAGGMGRVFLAISPGGRPVAVKVARAELADDPVFRARFRTEVALARRVQAFCTAPVVDADAESDPPWLATVYVPGPSLQQAVRDFGPLPAPTVRTLVAGLAEALSAVHADGIVHRDLKPSNVLLAADGPRLIDFGISRALEGTALTRTGLLVGSPGFIAPEQVRGGRAGPPADVFALGATMLYAATGRPPFGEGPGHAVVFRAVTQEPDLSGLPPDLRRLAARCLAKDPAERPTATEALVYLTDTAAATPSAPGWLPDAVATVAEQQATVLRTLPRTPAATRPETAAATRAPAPARSPAPAQAPAAAAPAPAPAAGPAGTARSGTAPPQWRPPARPGRAQDPPRPAPIENPYQVRAPGREPAAADRPGAVQPGPFRYGATPWPRNGSGTASLIIGLLGIVLAFGPGIILGPAGIWLGIRGIRRANRREATNRTVAVIGVAVSVLALLFSLASIAERGRARAGCPSAGYTSVDC
jgi:hypothetical protein